MKKLSLIMAALLLAVSMSATAKPRITGGNYPARILWICVPAPTTVLHMRVYYAMCIKGR